MSHTPRSISTTLLLCATLAAAPGCLFTNTATPEEDMGSDNNTPGDMSSNNTSPADMGMMNDMESDMSPPDPCEAINEDEACLTSEGDKQRCGTIDIDGCEIDCTSKCMDTCDSDNICSCVPPDREDACRDISCGEVAAVDSCGASFTLTCDNSCGPDEVCDQNTCVPEPSDCPTEEQICMNADASCGLVAYNNCGEVGFATCKPANALEGTDYCSALTLELPMDVKSGHKFGEAMALLGSTLVVSAMSPWPGGLGGRGEVYVYKLETGKLPGPPRKLPRPPDVEGIDGFGETLLLVDENTLLVGAPGDQTSQTVYVYQLKNGNWVEQKGSRLNLPSTISGRAAGFGTAMAQNNYTIYISAPGASNATMGRAEGSVFVYELKDPRATPPEFELVSTIENPRLVSGFGSSLAPFLSEGENSVFVGAPGRDNVDAATGSVYSCIPVTKELQTAYECTDVVVNGADVLRYENLGTAMISNQLTDLSWEAWVSAPGQDMNYKQVFHITPGVRGTYQMDAYDRPMPPQSGHQLALIADRIYTSGFSPQSKAPVSISPSVPGSTNIPFFRNAAPIKANNQAEFGRSMASGSALLLVGAPGAFSQDKTQQPGQVFAFPNPELP